MNEGKLPPRIIVKKITLSQAEQAVKLAKKIGFHTEGSFILGHPHETIQTAYKTIYFAIAIKIGENRTLVIAIYVTRRR